MTHPNRILNNKLYGFKYEYWPQDTDFCLYCGQPRQAWDHVPPISAAHRFKGDFYLVPACNECNGLLHNFDVQDINARREYLIDVYKRRFKKYLNIPNWDNSEIRELDYSLKDFVEKGLCKRSHCWERLRILAEPIELPQK